MAKVYGNWCGSNWTDGRKISARDYLLSGGDFKGACIDNLDCACRDHDKDCSSEKGCSAKADRKLASVARDVLDNPFDRLFRPMKYGAAAIILPGITAASLFRQR